MDVSNELSPVGQRQALLQPIKIEPDYSGTINAIRVLAKKTRRSFTKMVIVLVERGLKIVNAEEGITS
jgi:hypothetical protein